ncbi:GLPGLI family protein [Paraflavisolibacter sp. H34]|uniref:GLPGLI family protein n=1 Tax=Huijunlia imazamoxiresistens TaxID=3127457 RepID=UPI003017F685
MKTKLLCVCLSFFSLAQSQAQSQVKEGKITYERTITFQQRNRNNNNNPDADNRPRSRTDRFELSFSATQSLWESLPDMNAGGDEAGGGGGGNFGGGGGMRFFGAMGGDDLSYVNFASGRKVDQRELAQKTYIVEDSIQKLKWKLTGESQTILGYKAQMATAEQYLTRTRPVMENGEMKMQEVQDTSRIIAWFTPQIPVPAGPSYPGQLPGLILQLEINNGRMVYKAVEFSPKVNVNSIKEPKGGKRISAADYAKENQKVMEEMRRNFQGGRGIRMNAGGGGGGRNN